MKKYLPISLLILLGLATRLLPHPANFTAITAIALFGGLYLPRRAAAITLLLAMLFSDVFIGLYSWPIMTSVYGSFLLTIVIGQLIQKHRPANILAATLVSGLIFFLITNWAVWSFGTMYPHTISGLMLSYYNALPFYRNMLLGDLFYVALLVGGYELLARRTATRPLEA